MLLMIKNIAIRVYVMFINAGFFKGLRYLKYVSIFIGQIDNKHPVEN